MPSFIFCRLQARTWCLGICVGKIPYTYMNRYKCSKKILQLKVWQLFIDFWSVDMVMEEQWREQGDREVLHYSNIFRIDHQSIIIEALL